jgi:hypothetical protein
MMKNKTLFSAVLVLILTLLISFLPEAKGKKVVKKINPEPERAKWERYVQAKQRKRELHAGVSALYLNQKQPGDKPLSDSVQITADDETFTKKSDGIGKFMFLGTCTNTGTSSAVFVKVDVKLFDNSNNEIGEDFAYVRGGSNVKLSSTGYYTNALGPGETGYFMVWTSYDYSQVNKNNVQYSFDYETYSHTPANASLDFVGTPSFSSSYYGYLNISGQVKNFSSSWLTYFTKVYFGIFNSMGQVIDVDFTYIQGSSYNTGIVTTDTALSPGETGSFSNTFYHSTYSDFSSDLYSFEWDEVSTSPLSEKDPPFGSFDTPLTGSTVRSSVPVTGWALDDSGVEHVKIYRHQGGSLLYIGNATLVEGARPDVAAMYPQYPNNTRAGWGYMMLTNFLPDGGNGTFILEAIATDAMGKSTSLGTKTITCDNAHAVKPFGAIDSPSQGGTVSGSSFINWGWALTPQPNKIPEDGSTISVFVDSVNIGHPNYNIYRADIADLFPTYANSNGAVGYFYLDTTTYNDGVHTIQWTATDNDNNTDGIGSRYFTIQNTDDEERMMASRPNLFEISSLPSDYVIPVLVKRGFKKDVMPEALMPDETGTSCVVAREMERIEMHLPKNSEETSYTGYMKAGNRLIHLPVGSTLEKEKGMFHWIPAPAFFGRYHLVFIQSGPDGPISKTNVVVEIIPR